MLGEFEVESESGWAGDGVDYRVVDPDGKRWHLWAGAPGSAERAGRDEIQAGLGRVYHTSLPRAHGAETVEGRALLRVADYAGETLAVRLARGPLPTLEAIDAIRTVAAGLVKAHAKGFHHGALTADHIICGEDGRMVLTGVGWGAFLNDRDARAPEGEPGATDVFALARVLVHALEGEEPYPGNDWSTPRDADSFDPALPEGLRRLLARALNPDPGRRMTRAEELAGDLGVIRASWDSMSAPPAKALAVPGRPLGWVVVAGIAIILAFLALQAAFR